MSFDHDLDVFAASIGLTKTSVATIIKDEGTWCFDHGRIAITDSMELDVTLDMDGLDINAELFEPLQKVLDQCKSAKTLSR